VSPCLATTRRLLLGAAEQSMRRGSRKGASLRNEPWRTGVVAETFASMPGWGEGRAGSPKRGTRTNRSRRTVEA
jgi:hypothetical protein